jgi:hypothetical protein
MKVIFSWSIQGNKSAKKMYAHILSVGSECCKPIDSINLLGLWKRRNVFLVRFGQTYRVELSFK